MSYDARIFRVLIASPSDVEEEREIVVKLIQAWNDLYSFTRKVALLPLRWETHTAPDYGTRPQEVINRAIVDDCDLLVGIFWTRIGSPTGVADSGTLEEIERAGKAGKPVMLYFSRVAIDPEKIDTGQIDKLKDFRTTTYPKGLVESYRTISEFRDKFNRQLEIKIRELQQSEPQIVLPLNLTLLSDKDARPLGARLDAQLSSDQVPDISEVPEEDRDRVKEILSERSAVELTQPIVIGIENNGSAGIRSCYVQLQFSTKNEGLTLSDRAPGRSNTFSLRLATYLDNTSQEASQALEKTFTQYEPDVLTEAGGVWRLALEWDAIQPQRLRLVRPFLFLHAKSSGTLEVEAKVYSDSFAAPYVLHAEVDIQVEYKNSSLQDVLPDWQEMLVQEKKKKEGLRALTFPRAS